MTKLEKLYSIIENSREVGVKLSKDVLQQASPFGMPSGRRPTSARSKSVKSVVGKEGWET